MLSLDSYRSQLNKAGHSVDGSSRNVAAGVWGVSSDKARHILDKLRRLNGSAAMISDKPSKAETITVTKDTYSIEIPKTRIKSLEELIEAFQVDTKIWEVERWTANKWEVGAKDDAGNITVEPLYQVKATFKRINGWNPESIKAEVERIKEVAKKDIKPFNVTRVKSKSTSGKNLLEISIPDIHVGGMSWSAETGRASWDHKIASKKYRRAFDDLLTRGLSTAMIDKLLFVVGNDLANVDSQDNKTTKGTVVDQDSRYHKMYLEAFEMLRDCINNAVQVVDVDVVIMPGNHDRLTSFGIGHSLECLYHDNLFIKIDNRPLTRKYYRYGTNLIGICHGDTVKHKDLPLLMATESPEFSQCKFREFHLGHTHEERLVENNGIKVRTIPSLCPSNAWAVANGWSSNLRGAQAFTWNHDRGLIATTEHYIDLMEE